MMRSTLRWAGACILLTLLVLLILRPWVWGRCLPRIADPLPPADQLRQPPLQPGTFPGELAKLLDSTELTALPAPQSVESLPSETRHRLRYAATTVQEKLREILEAPPGQWVGPDKPADRLRLLSDARQIARLLDLNGRLALAEGSRDECRRSAILLIRFGRRLTERSTAVGFLTGTAIEQLGHRLLLLWMDCPEVTIEELSRLCKRLKGLKERRASWDEVMRWEYADTKHGLSQPVGVSRGRAFLLHYLGVLGPCPISVARAVYWDAQNWDKLPPDKLWVEPWRLSGPAVPPRVPGLSLTRAALDQKVRRNAFLWTVMPAFRLLLASHRRGELYTRIVSATAAAHAQRLATGRWPARLTDRHLARLGLSEEDVRDPFSQERLLWFPHKRALLGRARQLAGKRPYLPRERLANLRELLQPFPDQSPVVWVPLAAFAESKDHFGTSLFLVDRAAIEWLERWQAARWGEEAQAATVPNPPQGKSSSQQKGTRERPRQETAEGSVRNRSD